MKSRNVKLTLTAILLLAMLPALARAQGSVPHVVSYQGRVTVEGDLFHGIGLFKFAVMDGWGNSTWSNDGTSDGGSEPESPVELYVAEGLFSVLMGDDSRDMLPLTAEAFQDPECVLRVWFSPDGGYFVQLEPDRPLATVPFAFAADNADMVDGWHASELAPAGHNHWSQTWGGSGTGLTLNSSGGGPTIVASNVDNDGVYVSTAGGDGVEVHAAGGDGFYVGAAGDDGLQVGFQAWSGDYVGAADDGIAIYDAGSASSHRMPADVELGNTHDGVDIAGAKDFGLWVGYAGDSGVRIEESGGDGLRVTDSAGSGLYVYYAGQDGFALTTAADDGIDIYDAGGASTRTRPVDAGYGNTNDGIDIAGADDFGLWVGYAGRDGVHVREAAEDGLHVETAARHGVYAVGGSDRGDYGGHFTGHGGLYSRASNPAGYGLYSQGNAHVEGDLTWKAKTGYVSVPAAAFQPESHGDAYTYTNGGNTLCGRQGTPVVDPPVYYAPVYLPHGATVTRVVAYWQDGDASDSHYGSLTLWRWQPMALENRVVMAFMVSSGSSGEYSFSADESPSYANVDNSWYTYSLDAELWAENVCLHGVTIVYTFTEPY